jgi:NitT/TauT family transport system substrate-binding protein
MVLDMGHCLGLRLALRVSLAAIRRLRRLAAVLALALASVAPLAGEAAAQTAIKFSLDARVEGLSALFLYPLEKGYFRDQGLDVTLDEANSALDPITRVASGSYALGFADINALIRYRDQHPDAPVKAIFMVYNRPPFSIVSRKSRGITTPKQLEGKKLGAPPSGTTVMQWPLFAKINDIDLSKVSIERISLPVRAPMLAAGQLDAALGYSFRVYIDLKDRGVALNDIVLMPMADYGLKLYGSAIIVNTKFAMEKPEATRAFLDGFLKGLKETIRNPAAAVAPVLKRDDGLNRDVEIERLHMAIHDNIVTPEVRANGFGAIDPVRLEQSIDQIGLAYTYKNKPKAGDIFDSSFLPPAHARRVN